MGNLYSQGGIVSSRPSFQLPLTPFSQHLSDHHQLSLILDILGTPSLDDFYAITSSRSREYIRALPFRKKRNFNTLFPNANPLAVDLVEKCLTFSPKRRIDVEQALAHPYLAVSTSPDSFRVPRDLNPEVVIPRPVRRTQCPSTRS